MLCLWINAGVHCSNKDFVGGAVCLGLIPRQKLRNWLSRTIWVTWDLETFLQKRLKKFNLFSPSMTHMRAKSPGIT